MAFVYKDAAKQKNQFLRTFIRLPDSCHSRDEKWSFFTSVGLLAENCKIGLQPKMKMPLYTIIHTFLGQDSDFSMWFCVIDIVSLLSSTSMSSCFVRHRGRNTVTEGWAARKISMTRNIGIPLVTFWALSCTRKEEKKNWRGRNNSLFSQWFQAFWLWDELFEDYVRPLTRQKTKQNVSSGLCWEKTLYFTAVSPTSLDHYVPDSRFNLWWVKLAVHQLTSM